MLSCLKQKKKNKKQKIKNKARLIVLRGFQEGIAKIYKPAVCGLISVCVKKTYTTLGSLLFNDLMTNKNENKEVLCIFAYP